MDISSVMGKTAILPPRVFWSFYQYYGLDTYYDLLEGLSSLRATQITYMARIVYIGPKPAIGPKWAHSLVWPI